MTEVTVAGTQPIARSPWTASIRMWWLPGLLGAIAIALILRYYQVSVTASLGYSLYFLFVILTPGTLVWRAVIAHHDRANVAYPAFRTVLEDVVCGAAIGYLIELPTYCIARWIGHPRLYLLIPITLILGFVAHRLHSKSEKSQPLTPIGNRQAWILLGIVLYIVVWLGNTVFADLSMSNLAPIPDYDEPFHLSLLGEFRHHFPPIYPFIESEGLPYQWFVHAHMAASTWATGLEAVLVYRRFDPVILVALALLGSAVVTMRLAGRVWPGVLAPVILALVGSFDISGTFPGQAASEERFLLGPVLVHSPTQTFGWVLAIPATLLAVELVRRGSRFPLPSWALFLAVLIGLSGAKATFLPIFLAGFVLVAVQSSWSQRRIAWTPILGVVATAAVLLVTQQLIYAGESNTLGWQPLAVVGHFRRFLGLQGGGIFGDVLISSTVLLCWVIPGTGALGLFLTAERRRDERLWWLLGAIASGYGALFAFGHGGMSQLYFGRSVAPLVAILSAWGISELFPQGTTRAVGRRAVAVAVGGGLILWAARSITEQWRSPVEIDGDQQLRPVVHFAFNIPALLTIITLMFVIRLLLRDMSKRRLSLSLRFAVVFLVGLGLARTFAFATQVVPDQGGPQQLKLRIGEGGVAAARWLRDHSDPEDRIITNAHCAPTNDSKMCDNRHFWMAALTERRIVLEGWGYTVQATRGLTADEYRFTNPFWGDPSFLAENDALFTNPSSAALESFLERHPANWLLVDRSLPVRFDELVALVRVEVVFEEGQFVVLHIAEA